MRRIIGVAAAAATTGLVVLAGTSASTAQGTKEYVVLYEQGASASAAKAAIERAGGRLVDVNTKVGLAKATSSDAGFAAAARRSDAIEGVAVEQSIGRAPDDRRSRNDEVERLTRERKAAKGEGRKPAPTSGDPLASLQWDMRMIGATPDGSYAVNRGSKAVRVGIMDTGVDGSHPDIAPNFDAERSRNFTTDDPVVDGPCAEDPDGSCTDPADVDEDGHGTHVAGTVGAALNGIGMSGVAPDVSLVNLRAGQDSGYFFLQPVVDGLTYAADNGIDVVNMSFYIDPWLYNCAANPADTPEQQAQQRTIIAATQRAVDYARSRGVTLVAALGNEHTDLGNPTFDDTSPDYPPGTEHDRTIDNSCLDMPTEAEGVLSVSSVGPDGQKAYYSNYGIEQTDVSAPGGDYRDFAGTPAWKTPANLILAPYPESLARANGELEEDGTPNTPFVVRDCAGGRCAYYQYLQGTSMAAPHAAGVAALAVAAKGKRDAAHGGVTLDPDRTERIVQRSATERSCPEGGFYDEPSPDLPAEYDATCVGSKQKNGFFGTGLVNALAAARG